MVGATSNTDRAGPGRAAIPWPTLAMPAHIPTRKCPCEREAQCNARLTLGLWPLCARPSGFECRLARHLGYQGELPPSVHRERAGNAKPLVFEPDDEPTVCPRCGASRIRRNGTRYVAGEGRETQNWICCDCGGTWTVRIGQARRQGRARAAVYAPGDAPDGCPRCGHPIAHRNGSHYVRSEQRHSQDYRCAACGKYWSVRQGQRREVA